MKLLFFRVQLRWNNKKPKTITCQFSFKLLEQSPMNLLPVKDEVFQRIFFRFRTTKINVPKIVDVRWRNFSEKIVPNRMSKINWKRWTFQTSSGNSYSYYSSVHSIFRISLFSGLLWNVELIFTSYPSFTSTIFNSFKIRN